MCPFVYRCASIRWRSETLTERDADGAKRWRSTERDADEALRRPFPVTTKRGAADATEPPPEETGTRYFPSHTPIDLSTDQSSFFERIFPSQHRIQPMSFKSGFCRSQFPFSIKNSSKLTGRRHGVSFTAFALDILCLQRRKTDR